MAAIDPSNPTDAELLTAVNAAIYRLVVAGFSRTNVNGRDYTRNNLNELNIMKTSLEARVNAAAATSTSHRLGDISGTGL